MPRSRIHEIASEQLMTHLDNFVGQNPCRIYEPDQDNQIRDLYEQMYGPSINVRMATTVLREDEGRIGFRVLDCITLPHYDDPLDYDHEEKIYFDNRIVLSPSLIAMHSLNNAAFRPIPPQELPIWIDRFKPKEIQDDTKDSLIFKLGILASKLFKKD